MLMFRATRSDVTLLASEYHVSRSALEKGYPLHVCSSPHSLAMAWHTNTADNHS